MHATKETCIIALGAMGLALALMALAGLGKGRPLRQIAGGIKPLHLVLGLAAAMGVSALFYSSFFQHPQGVLDSYLTYATYLGRGAGGNTVHVHPWYYYLQMIVFARYFNGPIWTEGWIVLLALVGLAAAVTGRLRSPIDAKLVRFIALYTVVMTVVYSAVPYKTPWCLLSFLHGMILLAGVGAVTLLAWAARPAGRAVVIVAAGRRGGASRLSRRTGRISSTMRTAAIPYVYAHPTPEIFTIVEKVKEYAGRARPGSFRTRCRSRSPCPARTIGRCPGTCGRTRWDGTPTSRTRSGR